MATDEVQPRWKQLFRKKDKKEEQKKKKKTKTKVDDIFADMENAFNGARSSCARTRAVPAVWRSRRVLWPTRARARRHGELDHTLRAVPALPLVAGAPRPLVHPFVRRPF